MKTSLAELAIKFVDTGDDSIWQRLEDKDRQRFFALVTFVEVGRGEV